MINNIKDLSTKTISRNNYIDENNIKMLSDIFKDLDNYDIINEEESFESIKEFYENNDSYTNFYNSDENDDLKDNYFKFYKSYFIFLKKKKFENLKIKFINNFIGQSVNIKQLNNGIFIYYYKNNNNNCELKILNQFFEEIAKIIILYSINYIYELIDNKIIFIDIKNELFQLSIDKDNKIDIRNLKLKNIEKVQLFLLLDKDNYKYIISTLEKTFLYQGDFNSNLSTKKTISNESYRLGTIINKKLILINNKNNKGYIDIYDISDYILTFKKIYNVNICNQFNLSQNCISTIQLNNDEIIVFFCCIKKDELQSNGIFSIKLVDEIIDSFLDTKNFKINCLCSFRNFEKEKNNFFINVNNLNNYKVFDTRYLLVGGNNGIKIYMYKGIIKNEHNNFYIKIEYINDIISGNGNEFKDINCITQSRINSHIYISSIYDETKEYIFEIENTK